MSREILFRGKRKDNGEWVQGYLYKIWKQSYILWGMTNNVPDMIEIEPNTICQYTGLTDKNGKKIWENDIVKDNVVFGSVLWDERHVQFMIDDVHDGHQEYTDWWNEVEVIGNVFDNPELLEGGAE